MRPGEKPAVPLNAASTPAFGQADLSNCEREQIHLAGSIQPHGALLLVREPDHAIVQASENAELFLGLGDPLIGRALEDLPGDLASLIRPLLTDSLHTLPIAIRCRIGEPLSDIDALVHRPADGGLVVEFERAGPVVDVAAQVEEALQTILFSSSLASLCDETARIFKKLTGYDRVMVYRFDDDGHGQVFSEQREEQLEPYLGNRYPASDIPQIARRLYERNRVRMLVDVGYTPVPLTPRRSPISGQDLDMSLCSLRSSSPIHVQYLKNMGVSATLVVSLMVGGRLWGLISCHHYAPRFVQVEIRAACELLAEAVATRIAALESFVQAQAELSARRLEQRMIEALSREGDWKSALFDNMQSLLQPVGATGAALLFDEQVMTAGEVPGTPQLREIGKWLDRKFATPLIESTSLGIEDPQFASLTAVACGLLAAPLSNTSGSYLIWFRPEEIQTVTWGGDPLKPVIIGDNPAELSPRRSFAQWHEVKEGHSQSWSVADRAAARLIGSMVADVVLQSRSVRMLIAQDQLEQVRREVHSSDQPVVIANAVGKILLMNEAFEGLLRPGHTHIEWLEDLPEFFEHPLDVAKRLHDLTTLRRSWRSEVCVADPHGGSRPLLIRADPILASPDRLLGFVLMFNDVTEQKAAAAARHRFQDGILEQNRMMSGLLSSKDDLVYQNLLTSVVENAQLAALEITDRVDTARMPELLESLRASVKRTAEMLEHLLWHTSRSSRK
jgi:chemotaxis family two-component system sensor kinase Cph1